jgi:hypothetical protein
MMIPCMLLLRLLMQQIKPSLALGAWDRATLSGTALARCGVGFASTMDMLKNSVLDERSLWQGNGF